jgi:hypothetical protein
MKIKKYAIFDIERKLVIGVRKDLKLKKTIERNCSF